jgi:hypothetical protein
VAVSTEAIGVLDLMIERGEAAVGRYRARLVAMNGATFPATRLRAAIQVMQGRIDALRLSRDRQRSTVVDTPAAHAGGVTQRRH